MERSSDPLCETTISGSNSKELNYECFNKCDEIRHMKLSSHLKQPRMLAPLMDLEEEEVESHGQGRDLRLRDKFVWRRTRSLSSLRNTPLEWRETMMQKKT
ncbi:hypothetical protein VNO77_26963 [Canavalia gladiata]|uniref:Uncharacterized protein n=1 Tax=Canavalia gladiata TaxID=3824 RepID=A0AAN9KTY0_CANGL